MGFRCSGLIKLKQLLPRVGWQPTVHPRGGGVMPAPSLLACGLAKGHWVRGVAGQARQSPCIQRRKGSCISSLRAQGVSEQDSVRDQGINTALRSVGCGHSKMRFSAGMHRQQPEGFCCWFLLSYSNHYLLSRSCLASWLAGRSWGLKGTCWDRNRYQS